MPGDVAGGDQPVLFATAMLEGIKLGDPREAAVEKVVEEIDQRMGFGNVDLVLVAIEPGVGGKLRMQIEDRILGVNQTWCKCGHKEGQHYPGISVPARLCDVDGCGCKGFEPA